jgi:hypothetical protein
MKAKTGRKRRVKDIILGLIQPTITLAVASALVWLIATS